MMKKRNTNILLAVLCLTLTTAFYNFSTAEAQTTQLPNRARQVPTPTVTPKTIVSPAPSVIPKPSVSPTPEEDEVIKIDTELVNLNVRVVDRSNRSIGNLRQEDFKIYEDTVAQPIEFFTKSEVPTNYSLVIDNSNSLRPQIEKVIEAGKIIINSNLPGDETSIIRFVSSEKIEILRDFTNSKNELNDALDELYTEGGQTAIIDAMYLAAEKVNEYEKSVNPNDRKRRALILVSDGEDRDSFYKEKQLFDLLKEIDVQIYAIGFIGDLDKESSFISKSPQGKAKSLLERLASETGGKVYFPTDSSELNAIAADISRELRTQYSIGYIPTNEKKDGSFRNIKVTVTDGANKQKRIAVTRTGRTANNDRTTPPTLTMPVQKGKN
ncbi:MAG: VWA domain-containing protein [Pyrinomonadaceae bacterium]|nr:VWA domain-containing protein [Pyrinomonadaceae bacterium]